MPDPEDLSRFDLLEREMRLTLAELRLETEKLKNAEKPPREAGKENSAMWVAIVAGIVTALGYVFQAYQAHQLALDTLHTNLILKATDSGDPELRKKALLFYVTTGLLPDPDGKISRLKPEQIPQAPQESSSKAVAVGSGTYSHLAGAVVVHCGFSPDADGSPHAYHPDGHSGLDFTANTGRPGNWTGLVTDNGTPTGNPVVQGPNDPAPGFYISQTPLFDPSKAKTDPNRYVNSETINYVVLPNNFSGKAGEPVLGDFAAVYNEKTKNPSFAVVADYGSSRNLGQGSISLAKALGIPSDPKTGGTTAGIVLIVFPGSGSGWPKTQQQINDQGSKLLQTWGGIERVNSTVP